MIFAKKSYLKIIAEKPDIFGRIPVNVLPEEKIEELKGIPRLAVGEISCIQGLDAIVPVLAKKKPDAFLPTFSYTGTEYGDIKVIDELLKQLKKTIEKDLRIYFVDPVFLGAPDFWRALNGRFAYEVFKRFKVYSACYGCRLYSVALRIPLCKKIDAKIFIYPGADAHDGCCRLYIAHSAIKYYKNLMSSFGIELWDHGMGSGPEKSTRHELFGCGQGLNYKCVFSEHFLGYDGSFDEPPGLDDYFESYAVPAAAKIISKALAGVDVDYVQEAAFTLFPAGKRKKGKSSLKKQR